MGCLLICIFLLLCVLITPVGAVIVFAILIALRLLIGRNKR